MEVPEADDSSEVAEDYIPPPMSLSQLLSPQSTFHNDSAVGDVLATAEGEGPVAPPKESSAAGPFTPAPTFQGEPRREAIGQATSG